MNLKIIFIEKNSKDEFFEAIKHYTKIVSKFAKLELVSLYDKRLSSIDNSKEARKIYSQMLSPFISNYNLSLDVHGMTLNSEEFSKLFKKQNISFFVGGPFGLCEEFLGKMDFTLSLSNLTFSHKIAKVILLEQIFRGLSILNNHPYHK